jgi:hypothetical protein
VTNYQQKQELTSSLIQDLLVDIRSGMGEEEIARKYGFAVPHVVDESGPEIRGGGAPECSPSASDTPMPDVPTNPAPQDAEESAFICPTCLTAFATMFDICPNCSASVQETMGTHVDKGTSEVPVSVEALQDFTKTSGSKEGSGQTEACSATVPGSTESHVGPQNEKELISGGIVAQNPGTHLNESVPFSEEQPPREPHVTKPSPQTPSPINISRHKERQRGVGSIPSLRCESCKSTMTPALRDIYDRSRGVQSIIGASIFFLLAYLSCVLLSFLETPSLPRLTIFFLGGIFVLSGSVLAAVGTFMYLAREKVYFCSRCKRTYPRADISYLAAALVWSSKRASGSL